MDSNFSVSKALDSRWWILFRKFEILSKSCTITAVIIYRCYPVTPSRQQPKYALGASGPLAMGTTLHTKKKLEFSTQLCICFPRFFSGAPIGENAKIPHVAFVSHPISWHLRYASLFKRNRDVENRSARREETEIPESSGTRALPRSDLCSAATRAMPCSNIFLFHAVLLSLPCLLLQVNFTGR